MKCKICSKENKPIFTSIVLDEFEVEFFYCENCGFLQTEEPYWLERAYNSPITIEDTGILYRNLRLRNMTSIFIPLLFNRKGKFLDYAGGHGIFTRLMRDLGYDFYWIDKYAKNLFSRGFEYNQEDNIEMITCFECFEHLEDPQPDIKSMLDVSNNILFSTELLPSPVPSPKDWWYYGMSHGQHISFYSLRTLQHIADTYNLNFYSFGSIHIYTEKKISALKLLILKLASISSHIECIKFKMKSKTVEDMNKVILDKSKII